MSRASSFTDRITRHGLAAIEALRAEDALAANGMTGTQLLKLAYQAANHYANTHPAFPVSRIEDLAQHLTLTICRRAPRYRPELNQGFDPALNPKSTPFRSWCWLLMGNACVDFNRRRSEGFGGRAGRDKDVRVTMTGDDQDFEDDTDFDREYDLHVTPERERRWKQAADTVGWTVSEWLAITADRAANDLLKQAA